MQSRGRGALTVAKAGPTIRAARGPILSRGAPVSTELPVPELPEVEIMARNVARWAEGARLTGVDIADPRVLSGGDPAARIGETLRASTRRAKWLVMAFEGGDWLWHFRMTGKFVRDDGRPRWRAALSFDNGERLLFCDTRCLGEWHAIEPGARDAFFADRAAGAEPYPDPQPGGWWQAHLGGTRAAIKTVMMDGRRICGIGNIMAAEILFDAGVSPFTPARDLDDAAWDAIAESAHRILHRVVDAETADEIAYVNDGGDIAQTPFCVYGREGEPCSICGTAIVRTKQGGRSTFHCPACQPG